MEQGWSATYQYPEQLERERDCKRYQQHRVVGWDDVYHCASNWGYGVNEAISIEASASWLMQTFSLERLLSMLLFKLLLSSFF
jgi:hypothetical protein